ncbi:MAG: hypothetical protein ABIH50_02460 [bacterium]
MKKSPLSCFFLLLLIIPSFVICHLSFVICPAYAQLKDLAISADKVTVEKHKQQIEATGSVEVTYKKLRLTGEHLIYNSSSEVLNLDRGFSCFYEGTTIEGKVIDFYLENNSGTAKEVSFLYEGVELYGKKLTFNKEEFSLTNAHFSTCNLREPHYHVSAANLNLYPKSGWLVAYWGLFWLGNLPIVPMPTYIYDFRAAERNTKNLPPFPEIGSNDEDGSYIIESLAWHLRRELSGSYSLGYAANKNLLLGLNGNYIINDSNAGNLRLNWNQVNRFYGGITHVYSFGREITPFFRQYQLEATLSSKERINYQRVSFLPNLRLREHGGEIAEFLYDYELIAGRVAEEGNTELNRGGVQGKVYQSYYDQTFGVLTPSLNMDALFYSNNTKWIKPSFGFDVAKQLSSDLLLGIGYQHYFFFRGQSPFNYEMYRFKPADRLTGALNFKLGETAAKIYSSYYLDNWTAEDIDYTLFFRLHCYNLEATYRSMRNEFQVGVSLAGN